jgi:hypothetical protein
MLDRLPTELLIHHLEVAAPLVFSPSFYLERRLFLRTCCLLSKQFCELAQPMLSEVFRVKQEQDVTDLDVDVGGRKRGSQVKLLVLVGNGTASLPHNPFDLRGALVLCTNVVELRLVDIVDFAFEHLSHNLRTSLMLLPSFISLLTLPSPAVLQRTVA